MYTELRDNLYSKKKYLQITYVAKDLLSRIHKPLRKFNFKIKLCGLKNVEMDSTNTFFYKGEHIDIEHTQVPSITNGLGTPTVDISSPNL